MEAETAIGLCGVFKDCCCGLREAAFVACGHRWVVVDRYENGAFAGGLLRVRLLKK